MTKVSQAIDNRRKELELNEKLRTEAYKKTCEKREIEIESKFQSQLEDKLLRAIESTQNLNLFLRYSPGTFSIYPLQYRKEPSYILSYIELLFKKYLPPEISFISVTETTSNFYGASTTSLLVKLKILSK